MITQEEKQNIKEFFEACDELIDGKFIISDIKIARLLKSVAKSEVLYNLFADCMVHFNFTNELQSAITSNKVNGGYFVLPTEEKKIVALVFCLLLEIDKGTMNLQNFVNDNFFSPDGYNISYSNFSLNVLVPFKTTVKNLLNVDDDGNQLGGEAQEEVQEEIEHSSGENLLYANLLASLNELYQVSEKVTKIKQDEREEILIIIRAMQDAIKLKNLRIINALCIPLEYLTKNRALRSYYEKFKTDLINYYYN